MAWLRPLLHYARLSQRRSLSLKRSGMAKAMELCIAVLLLFAYYRQLKLILTGPPSSRLPAAEFVILVLAMLWLLLPIGTIAYQTACPVEWNGVTGSKTGRTLEEGFALQNLSWCQHMDQKDIKLRIGANTTKQLDDLATRLFKRVNGKSFKKTDFALALLMRDPETWTVPTYISQGLKWLENVVKPEAVPPVATTEDGQ
jgi:hypothetical protein